MLFALTASRIFTCTVLPVSSRRVQRSASSCRPIFGSGRLGTHGSLPLLPLLSQDNRLLLLASETARGFLPARCELNNGQRRTVKPVSSVFFTRQSFGLEDIVAHHVKLAPQKTSLAGARWHVLARSKSMQSNECLIVFRSKNPSPQKA